MHIAAIESDRGGFTPRGFTIQNSDDNLKFGSETGMNCSNPICCTRSCRDTAGWTSARLKFQGATLIGYPSLIHSVTFDFHHAATDVFEAVNKREFELGAASKAGLVYLIDQYGLPQKGEAPPPAKH